MESPIDQQSSAFGGIHNFLSSHAGRRNNFKFFPYTNCRDIPSRRIPSAICLPHRYRGMVSGPSVVDIEACTNVTVMTANFPLKDNLIITNIDQPKHFIFAGFCNPCAVGGLESDLSVIIRTRTRICITTLNSFIDVLRACSETLIH